MWFALQSLKSTRVPVGLVGTASMQVVDASASIAALGLLHKTRPAPADRSRAPKEEMTKAISSSTCALPDSGQQAIAHPLCV